MEPQKEEAEKTSQKQNKSDASSSEMRNLWSSTQTAEEEIVSSNYHSVYLVDYLS